MHALSVLFYLQSFRVPFGGLSPCSSSTSVHSLKTCHMNSHGDDIPSRAEFRGFNPQVLPVVSRPPPWTHAVSAPPAQGAACKCLFRKSKSSTVMKTHAYDLFDATHLEHVPVKTTQYTHYISSPCIGEEQKPWESPLSPKGQSRSQPFSGCPKTMESFANHAVAAQYIPQVLLFSLNSFAK